MHVKLQCSKEAFLLAWITYNVFFITLVYVRRDGVIVPRNPTLSLMFAKAVLNEDRYFDIRKDSLRFRYVICTVVTSFVTDCVV